MTTDIATRDSARELRLPIGLIVSTGAPKPANGPGRPIDHFRFKEGTLEQYAAEATLAREVYGDEPRQLDDILLLSNDIRDILDIRLRAWGKNGNLRIVGKTNFATLPPNEYAARVDSFEDEILYMPREASEVPARMRDAWQGEPIPSKLDGPDDARIEKYRVRVEATLRFGLPRVLGLGKVAVYSTGSRHNRDALYNALLFAHDAFRGNLIGVQFRLAIRKRRSSYFNDEKRAWLPTEVYEVVLDTPWTLQEAIDAVSGMREALGGGKPLELTAGTFFADSDERKREDAERAILESVAGISPADDEETQLREEPEATVSDAQLNRIANLEKSLGADAASLATASLLGVFGVASADRLSGEDAERYESMLRAYLQSQTGTVAEAEVVEDAEVVEEEPSFEDMLPTDVKEQQKGRRSK